jgi:putative transposase
MSSSLESVASLIDKDGYELDVFLQKRRNKRAAIRFLSRLLGSYPKPRVIVTDKLRSYSKPIKTMCKNTDHRCHKRLNNRAENVISLQEEKKSALFVLSLPKVFNEHSLYG